tara:strand:+ start:150 stop:359 length:210 start_codon:yes stop_codon:yes gene_type:complete
MENLIVKQVLRQKNIPDDMESEIKKYLPLPKQEKIKKKLIKEMNIWHRYWNSRGGRLARISYYKHRINQ